MSISLNSTFHWIHAGPVTMGDSRHHVLSHPIKKHNRLRSACHSQACLHVGQSVYSSASCGANWSSSTYLQIFKGTVGRSSYSFTRMHTHVSMSALARTHMHQQLTFSEMKHSNFNGNLKPYISRGLHTIHTRACQYIQFQNHPEQPISHTHDKIRAVPLGFPKFTEGGVPNSEKEGRKQRSKGKKEKQEERVLFISEQFQKADQWHLFLGCVEKTLDNLGFEV